MKTLFNLVRFPFLFLFYVGSSLAAGFEPGKRQAVATGFAISIVCGVIGGAWMVFRPPVDEVELGEQEEGLYYIPAATEDAVVRVTVLESALGLFHFHHGRSPRDFDELARANFIRDLPSPKPGNEFQLDFETPAILEVPVGTPPPRHPDEPESTE